MQHSDAIPGLARVMRYALPLKIESCFVADDKKKLQDALVAVQYLKVFTNMAQGCAMGEDLFIKGGR